MGLQRSISHFTRGSRIFRFDFEPLILLGSKLAVTRHLVKGLHCVGVAHNCHVVRRPEGVAFRAGHAEMEAHDGP